jgi:hypothetical protein
MGGEGDPVAEEDLLWAWWRRRRWTCDAGRHCAMHRIILLTITIW